MDADDMPLYNSPVQKWRKQTEVHEVWAVVILFAGAALIYLILLVLSSVFADRSIADGQCFFRMDLLTPIALSWAFSTFFFFILTLTVSMPKYYNDRMERVGVAMLGCSPAVGILQLGVIIAYQVMCGGLTTTVALVFYWIGNLLMTLPSLVAVFFLSINLLKKWRKGQFSRLMSPSSKERERRSLLPLFALLDRVVNRVNVSPADVYRKTYHQSSKYLDKCQQVFLLAYHGQRFKNIHPVVSDNQELGRSNSNTK